MGRISKKTNNFHMFPVTKNLKEILIASLNSLTAPFLKKIRLKMFFPLSTIKKFYAEIVFVA